MTLRTYRNTAIFAIASVLAGIFFAIDLLLPFGIVEGILYVPIVLMTLWLPGNRYTLGFAVAATVLVGVGFVWSSQGQSLAVTVTNRLISVAGIWLATIVAILYKKNQQALQSSEARNKLILETAAEGVISFTSDGHIESVNPAAERMFGYSRGDIRGEAIDHLFPRLSQLRLFESSIGLQTNGQGESANILHTTELLGHREDGTTFPVQTSISQVRVPTGVLYTAIIQDITDRRRLERQLIGVPEEERQQIGYDLHEGVGQTLNGIQLLAENLVDRLEDQDPPAAQTARRICDALAEADSQISELIYQLTPVNLAANELAGALEHLVKNAPVADDVRCEFHAHGGHPIEDNTVITHLYRIAREALANAIEYGEASRLIMRLHQGADEVRLEVEDNGRGIEGDLESTKGMGLQTMEYRAHIIGATLGVDSTPEGGTLVQCVLPKRTVQTNNS